MLTLISSSLSHFSYMQFVIMITFPASPAPALSSAQQSTFTSEWSTFTSGWGPLLPGGALYFRVGHLYFRVEYSGWKRNYFSCGCARSPDAGRYSLPTQGYKPPTPLRCSPNAQLYQPTALSWLILRNVPAEFQASGSPVFHPPQQWCSHPKMRLERKSPMKPIPPQLFPLRTPSHTVTLKQSCSPILQQFASYFQELVPILSSSSVQLYFSLFSHSCRLLLSFLSLNYDFRGTSRWPSHLPHPLFISGNTESKFPTFHWGFSTTVHLQ